MRVPRDLDMQLLEGSARNEETTRSEEHPQTPLTPYRLLVESPPVHQSTRGRRRSSASKTPAGSVFPTSLNRHSESKVARTGSRDTARFELCASVSHAEEMSAATLRVAAEACRPIVCAQTRDSAQEASNSG